jgi:hypothetical protein
MGLHGRDSYSHAQCYRKLSVRPILVADVGDPCSYPGVKAFAWVWSYFCLYEMWPYRICDGLWNVHKDTEVLSVRSLEIIQKLYVV